MALSFTTSEGSTGERRIASSTRCAYERDLKIFRAAGGKLPCGPEQVREYAQKLLARIRPITVYRRLMAIRSWHRHTGHPDPVHADVLRDVRQAHRLSCRERAKFDELPLQLGQPPYTLARALADAVLGMGHSTKDQRDRAVLLLLAATAKRRSQLAALDCADITLLPDGMAVQFKAASSEGERVQRSGQHDVVVVRASRSPLCPVASMTSWMKRLESNAGRRGGALFRRLDRAGDPTTNRLDAAYIRTIVKQRLRIVLTGGELSRLYLACQQGKTTGDGDE